MTSSSEPGARPSTNSSPDTPPPSQRLLALSGVAFAVLLVGSLGVLFDWWELTGAVGLLVAPEFLWELLLGIYAAIWGFRRAAPILSGREH